MRNFIALLCAVVWVLMPVAARADVVVSFYSYDLDLGLTTHFPHAFVTMKGRLADGRAIDENIGFTAKSVSPAILMGSVAGMIEVKPASYINKSVRHFDITVDDAHYAGIKAIEAKWRALPGKSYDLGKRNCIHFVAEIATYLGLQVDLSKAYVKKPRAFLERILALNPFLVAITSPRTPKKSKRG
jgi:hypothetical protein